MKKLLELATEFNALVDKIEIIDKTYFNFIFKNDKAARRELSTKIVCCICYNQTIVKNRGDDYEMKQYEMEDYIRAHKFSANHMEILLKDNNKCGCFYCFKIFDPTEVEKWVADKSGTDICPHCGIDSVIGESSGYPITLEFLRSMSQVWF